MKLLRFTRSFMKNKIQFHRKASASFSTCVLERFKERNLLNRHYLKTGDLRKQVYTENENEFDDLEHIMDTDLLEYEMVKYSLFPNSPDKLIVSLNNCASIEEILNFFSKHRSIFDTRHLVQTVLVLRDMQIMYQRFNNFGFPSSSFINNLYRNSKFIDLLSNIKNNLSNFDTSLLSELLLYLNRLGIDIEDKLLQDIALQLRNNLRDRFCIRKCSRLLTVVFREKSVRPYNICLDLIPKIIGYIGKCDTVEELEDLTVCLNKLHKLITQDVLNQYKEKILFFLKKGKLRTDCKALLRIIEFLNYPDWRDQNVILLSHCMLLLQDKISLLNVHELIKLYGVFQKNQESAELLNSIQRTSSLFLQQIEEGEIVDINTHLMLFSTLIYFSTPTHRVQFQKDIKNIFKHCNKYNTDFRTLVILGKIFSYVKISDKTLCERYWDLTVEMLGENPELNNINNYCQNYLTFNTDIDSYRHFEFEHRIMTLISKTVNKQTISPGVLAHFISFFIVYGKDSKLMYNLLKKFEENRTQFNAMDCLKISHSLLLLSNTQNSCMRDEQIKKIKDLLNQITKRVIKYGDHSFKQNGILLRAAILRNDYDNYFVDNLLIGYKEINYISSKMLENICFSLLSTGSLIPEVINKCTEYIVNNCKNVIGFNVEKVLYLCYNLAYYPINAEKFFKLATDIIIRDQERLSGLSFLHCALALCFFNKLPGSFIKQIFNVEFMDKLDGELANCYSKEKYPQRVRNCLMQLNRAVCLEYPEYSVPWFHKKNVEDMKVKYLYDSSEVHFPISVGEYLRKVAGKPENILQNVVTPYGYLIDFVVNVNCNGKIVSAESTDIKRRIAILLIRPYAFTRFYTHLKGKYQLKKKHLEMFGYEVSTVIFNEWINLLYSGERIEYISNLLWPKCREVNNYISKR